MSVDVKRIDAEYCGGVMRSSCADVRTCGAESAEEGGTDAGLYAEELRI